MTDVETIAREIANTLWTQITKQMKFIGIITPETPNHLRIWIGDQIATALHEYGATKFLAGAIDQQKRCKEHGAKTDVEGYRRGINKAIPMIVKLMSCEGKGQHSRLVIMDQAEKWLQSESEPSQGDGK